MVLSYFSAVNAVGLKRTTMLTGRNLQLGADPPYRCAGVVLRLATMIVVLIGVAGAGKSTVGPIVAAHLGVPFLDADDFHDQTNINAMRAGLALNDRQRQRWLQRLNDVLRAHQASGLVLACSALKRSYRETLREGLEHIVFVMLAVQETTLASRLNARVGHYAGPALLSSQLTILEVGDDVVAVDGEVTPEDVANEVIRVISPPDATGPASGRRAKLSDRSDTGGTQ